MNAIPWTPVAFSCAWSLACMAAAAWQLRSAGRPFGPAAGLVLGGLGLLAVAPWTWTLLHLVDQDPSLLASGIQVGVALLLFAAAWRAKRAARDPEAAASSHSYAEKSAWLVLVAVLAIYGSYLARAWGLPAEQTVGLFLGSLVMLIVVMIVGHTVIALLHSPVAEVDAAPDERDRAIELRSSRNAYFALAAGFWSVPALLLLPLPASEALQYWFALLVFAEVVYYGSVVAYYRRGTI